MLGTEKSLCDDVWMLNQQCEGYFEKTSEEKKKRKHLKTKRNNKIKMAKEKIIEWTKNEEPQQK